MLNPTVRAGVLTNLLCAFVVSAQAEEIKYRFTLAEARAQVRVHYRIECEENRTKPRLPYRDTFERAMRGDIAALQTVFTDRNYHSGDNESWSSTGWPLLHVVGDKRFSAFLHSLDVKGREDVFAYVFAGSTGYEKAIETGYFARRFPRVAAIYRALPKRQTSNQAMQRTASKVAIDVLRIGHPHFGCVAHCSGLAVADLVSR